MYSNGYFEVEKYLIRETQSSLNRVLKRGDRRITLIIEKIPTPMPDVVNAETQPIRAKRLPSHVHSLPELHFYSYRKASTGFRRAACHAGAKPDTIPVITEMKRARTMRNGEN